VIPVLLLRGGGQAPVTPVPEPTITAPGETGPSSTPTTPSTSPSTTTPSTTPSTPGTSTFTLPEGTKLQRGEGDPAVIKELQQALSTAGFDPGPADGTFGRRTEAAVIAFQQANGLSADGVVGPETASALNSAVAGG
jgi:peptidoglycan hydrolase-like protein with peptidoglycan-binding domain